MTDLYMCNNYGTQCSADAYNSRLDGTFICNYHLGRYFKILKSRFEIPSGTDNRSYKMLIGQSLLSQEASNRILIPLTHEEHFNTASRSAMEKFVLYTIYEDTTKGEELCKDLVKQEYFEQSLWTRFQYNINTIMGMVSPTTLCKQLETPNEVRTYEKDDIVKQFPPFLRNLISRLVRPRQMNVGGHAIIIETKDTCSFTSNGLYVEKTHNPNIPIRADNILTQPKFSMRTVVEFDGRATLEQRALDMYDNIVLSRPLLNGNQVNT